MNARLKQIQNWRELAEQAEWSAALLAKKCGVSLRTLERHFLEKFGKCPRCWIGEMQQQRALEHLRSGFNVNETANKVGYGHTSSFCRKFPGLREKANQMAQLQLDQANLSQTANQLS
jgi:AraC-like DNA-binding protein